MDILSSILYKNSANGGFLKVNAGGIWNHVNELFIVTLKFNHLIHIDYLENIELCTYYRCWNILYNIKKSHWLVSPSISVERGLTFGMLSSLHWQNEVFQNSNFHSKTWILSLATTSVVYPKSDRLTSFFRKYLLNIQLFNHGFSISCSL